MTISEWLDQEAARGVDVSHIVLPADLTAEEEPDETVYFREVRTCGVLCTGDHPFATVERFGHWFYSRGREKEAGLHTTRPPWWLITKDKNLAISTARSRIEKSGQSSGPDSRGV